MGLVAVSVLQTFFIVILLFTLMPLHLPKKKTLILLGITVTGICIVVGILSFLYGAAFLPHYGYIIVCIPLYTILYIFSKAKGSRFVFVVLTAFIFQRIISTILMVVRVYSGGYTPLYFLMNLIFFGALIFGARYLKKDFNEIIFAYQREFNCLSIILILLLTLVWISSPIIGQNEVDSDILFVSGLLYVTVVVLYMYIGVSFHSFSKAIEAERSAISLEHQMQAAHDNIKLLQAAQEQAKLYRHDQRHHIMLISEFLEKGNIEGLKRYLMQEKKDIETMSPKNYCINEAANLLFSSFTSQANSLGIYIEIDAQIPQSLTISSTELCTLLSNAIENAITATARVNDGRERKIKLKAVMSDRKLLLSVVNPYMGTVHMEDGLPQSSGNEHGFGTKSIATIAEKYDGLSSFNAENGIFTLHLII